MLLVYGDSAESAVYDLPDPKNHGWTEDFQIDWIINAFPTEIEMLLVSDSDEEAEYLEESTDSDEDD